MRVQDDPQSKIAAELKSLIHLSLFTPKMKAGRMEVCDSNVHGSLTVCKTKCLLLLQDYNIILLNEKITNYFVRRRDFNLKKFLKGFIIPTVQFVILTMFTAW